MPTPLSCACGDCPVCRRRQAQDRWRDRKQSGVSLTAEERSRIAQEANRVRWGTGTRAAHRSPAEKLEYDRQRAAELRGADQDVWTGPGPSDEELDRRAAEMLYRDSRL